MHRTLRVLIIAAAALSTIVAGLRETFAEPASPGAAVQAVDGDALHGSREDDSGTRSEQVEEDDTEAEDDRELHFFATTSLTDGLDATVGRMAVSSRPTSPHARQEAAFGRGPPAAR